MAIQFHREPPIASTELRGRLYFHVFVAPAGLAGGRPRSARSRRPFRPPNGRLDPVGEASDGSVRGGP